MLANPTTRDPETCCRAPAVRLASPLLMPAALCTMRALSVATRPDPNVAPGPWLRRERLLPQVLRLVPQAQARKTMSNTTSPSQPTMISPSWPAAPTITTPFLAGAAPSMCPTLLGALTCTRFQVSDIAQRFLALHERGGRHHSLLELRQAHTSPHSYRRKGRQDLGQANISRRQYRMVDAVSRR